MTGHDELIPVKLSVGQTSPDLKPDFRDGVEHVYDVRVAIAVGLTFDHEPDEKELREAMLAAFWAAGDSSDDRSHLIDPNDDIEYELLEVDDHG